MNGTTEYTRSIIETERLQAPAERYMFKLQLLKQSIIAGHCYGDWQAVLAMTEMMKQLGDFDSHCRLLRAQANLELGNANEGTAELIELSNEDPWCAASHNLLGEARLMAKKYKEAVRSYTTAISIKPISSLVASDNVCYIGRAIALTFLGRHVSAATDVSMHEMLRQLRTARLHFWKGEHAECAETIKAFPSRVKDLPTAQYLKLRNTMATGNYKQALQEFPKLRFNSRGGLPLLWMRALCSFKTGRIESALIDLTKILNLGERIVLSELNPTTKEVEIVDLSQVLKLRATCEIQLKNFSAALEDLERAIYQSPDAESYFARADVLYRLGLPDRALADLEKAAELKGEDNESKLLKMLCLTRVSRRNEAAKIAQSILQTEPRNAIAKKTLSLIEQASYFANIHAASPLNGLPADLSAGQ